MEAKVYQTRGSAGRSAAKWHRLTHVFRSACGSISLELSNPKGAAEIPPELRCTQRACMPAWDD